MKKFNKTIAGVMAFAMIMGSLMMSPATSEAAKKAPKLNKKKITVPVKGTATVKVKNGAKKAKVTWKVSNKKIVKITKKSTKGSKAFAKIKGKKAGKAKLTAVYKLGKKSKKLNCTVKVSKKAVVDEPTVKPGDNNVVTPEPGTTDPTIAPTPTPEPFTIVDNGKANAMMYIDPNDSEYDGISIIAESFKADIARVTGIGVDWEGIANESEDGLKIVTDVAELSGKAIIAGTVGENGTALINQLVDEGKLDVSEVAGKWEVFKMQVVKDPVPGVDEALVIAGSDKRGTIYGIFRVSELMGISPWVWWADAAPTVQEKIDLNGVDIDYTSKEPSVKYRGIFLNDEAPSLTTWTDRKFGGRNHKFYKHVFELILRLKGDYLWPAMWGNEFSKDGTDGGASNDTLANAKLADKYGIVMGTSHHEPLYRAGNEWGQEYNQYKGSLSMGSAQAWNSYNLPGESGYDQRINTAIENFWNDGVKRNGQFDNICTVGMRGEADSSLPAADNPPKYAQLLNHIINQQKKILENNGDTNPTQLVIYKEVENAWNEGALYDQDCMKDTIAMFADDNWAYLRTLPTYEQQQQVGGLGMYYHFDYVGGPKSYTWIQTTQISRVWDQMSVAYDYGIDDVWVVNVGDLKPMELDISYFLDLGYDFEKWGVNGNEKIDEYKAQWIRQQFAKQDGSGLSEDQLTEAMQLISDYLDLYTLRKVEHLLYNTAGNCSDMFSVDNYSEAQDILMKCNDIMERAEALMAEVPEDLQAAFYQLVYYPAMATPNVIKIQIYAALNQKYANKNLTLANKYRSLCEEAIAFDQQIYDKYNNNMPGVGTKWQGMQSAGQKYHIGMTGWQTDSGSLPSLRSVNASGSPSLNVLVESITGTMGNVYTSGNATLPAFTNTNKEVYTIELANKASGSYNFTAEASADWIVLSKTSGTVNVVDNILVSVDWDKVTSNEAGTVKVSDGKNTVTVNVSANVTDTSELDEKTYVMANGYATIDVANYTDVVAGSGFTNAGQYDDNEMIYVQDNGKYMGSIRTSSSVITYVDEGELDSAPYVEYKVYVPKSGTYNIQSQFNPTSNVEYGHRELRYGISVDGGDIQIKNSIGNDYLAGAYQGTWPRDIEYNARTSTISGVSLSAGVHTIRYYQCDPNMALIRMVVHEGNLASVYSSPAESYYVGKEVDPAERESRIDNMYSYMK